MFFIFYMEDAIAFLMAYYASLTLIYAVFIKDTDASSFIHTLLCTLFLGYRLDEREE